LKFDAVFAIVHNFAFVDVKLHLPLLSPFTK